MAAQEGRYLGRLFNFATEELNTAGNTPVRAEATELINSKLKMVVPFNFQDRGKFAYVGENQVGAIPPRWPAHYKRKSRKL